MEERFENQEVVEVEVDETPKKSHKKGLIGLAIAAMAVGAAVVVNKKAKKCKDACDEVFDDDDNSAGELFDEFFDGEVEINPPKDASEEKAE